MKKLFALIVLFLCTISFGQNSIGELVLIQVNNLRDSLNLNHLTYDKVLEEAGIDHAYYMAKKQKLNHFQTTFTKESPSERVLYYNGNRTYVGENIASTSIKWKEKNVINNEALALDLFKGWLNSPPHYKNMIHPDYTKMGVGNWQSEDKLLYSAQVFSSNEIKLPKEFNNSSLSWGVRPSEFTCKDEPQTYETMFFANSVSVQGNSIYLFFHDLNFFEKVIQNDNDGLAIDVILREQLPCGKENQFHISKIFDGEMQRPIYKHDIFRNNISNNPKKIKVKIGEVPKHLRNKQWEANVIIINDNKLCDYSYPVIVPSDIFPLLDFNPYYDRNDSEIVFEPQKIRIKDSIHVELNYERSKGKFTAVDEYGLYRLMQWGQYINKLDVDCFASVEGAEWFNLQLLEERKESAFNLLLGSDFDFSKINFTSKENWDLMNRQIEEQSISELESKNKSQVKYWLKKNKSAKMDSLLYSQRKTHISAVVDTTIQISSYSNFQFANEYDRSLSISDLPWNKILREEYIIPQYELESGIIDSLKNNINIRTNLLGAASIDNSYIGLDSVLVEGLVKEVDSKNSKQLFNYANFVTRYWFRNYSRSYETKGVANTITPNELRTLILNIDTTIIQPNDFTRLKVNTLLSGIHYYVSHNNWEPVENYFDAIVALVKLESFTPQEAMELALFCNHFHKFEQAVEILDPFHENKSLSEDAYFVLAQTSTLIRQQLKPNTYWNYMESAKIANKRRYCKWLDSSFQIQRDEHIKVDFCNECR